MNWLDSLVASVAGEECLVYNLSNVRQQGNYTNLSAKDFAKVVAKLTNLKQWTAQCIYNSYSCGSFIIIPEGRGNISHQAMCIGPFQN